MSDISHNQSFLSVCGSNDYVEYVFFLTMEDAMNYVYTPPYILSKLMINEPGSVNMITDGHGYQRSSSVSVTGREIGNMDGLYKYAIDGMFFYLDTESPCIFYACIYGFF